MNGSRPEKEFKIGAVRAAVWSNTRATHDGRQFDSVKIAVERIYKDSDGSFKSTGRFDINDIPKLIIALNRAYEYSVLRQNTNGSQREAGGYQSYDRIP